MVYKIKTDKKLGEDLTPEVEAYFKEYPTGGYNTEFVGVEYEEGLAVLLFSRWSSCD